MPGLSVGPIAFDASQTARRSARSVLLAQDVESIWFGVTSLPSSVNG